MLRKPIGWGLVGALLIGGAAIAQDPPPRDPAKKDDQKGPGRGFTFPNAATLLSNPDVQKELKLSESDKSNIKLLQEELVESGRKYWEGLRDLAPQERMPKFAERTKEEEKLVAEVIGDKMKRYNEIRLQQSVQMFGLMGSLQSPANSEKLKLTEDQKTKLRDKMMESFRDMGKFFGPDAEGDQASRDKAMAELRKKQDETATALLTDQQKATWKEMLGAPVGFEFPKPPAFGGFGGGRRGGGGRPPGGGAPPPPQA